MYSKHATAVTLLLYGEDDLVQPQSSHRLDYRQHKTGRVWHCRIPFSVVENCRYYAYTLEGETAQEGNGWQRFDSHKVLFDPYAREILFPPGFDRLAAIAPGSNAGRAPLGELPPENPRASDLNSHRAPRHEGEAVIYELHVDAFTDNSTFYVMTHEPGSPFANHSGTGNTLHTANYYVRKMILDSLRYWIEEMHVDGFRFDLASVFARRADGTVDVTSPGIFAEIAADPVLSRARLIAEPWDASGAHLLGRSLPGISWAQWNSRFRDDVRRFARGDPGVTEAMVRRLYGSDDLFPDDRMNCYRPPQSINYVTSHDGFTLYDLVSYSSKRNWANGEENRDGADENYSFNCGWEGDDGVPANVITRRKREAKLFGCLLLLANGTPMIRAGDEFFHTQGGNNNPYNQNNETSWLDWSRLEANADVHRFFRGMIAFRKAHPSISRSRFWREDVTWYGYDGSGLPASEPVLAYHLDGSGQGDADLYVMINVSAEARDFLVPAGPGGWCRAVDTALDAPDDLVDPGAPVPIRDVSYRVGSRSVVVLVSMSEGLDGLNA